MRQEEIEEDLQFKINKYRKQRRNFKSTVAVTANATADATTSAANSNMNFYKFKII